MTGASDGKHRSFDTAVWLLISAGFLLMAAVRAPTPAVNEPHYLCKAKHFWNPDWCADDFFLDSAETHIVFYTTIGVLTKWFSLLTSAWLGRMLACLFLGLGWLKLIQQLAPGRWTPLWTAWVYQAIFAIGNFSGEWIVGGVEAKVFSYAFVFLALADWFQHHYRRAGFFMGLAVSFHPLVGLWSVITIGFAWMISITERPSLKSLAVPAGLFLLASLPGLIPALQLLLGTPQKLTFQATYIQVFYRLSHYLDPTKFPASSYIQFGLLLTIWAVGRRYLSRTCQESFFAKIILGSFIIAVVGWFIGYGPRPPVEMPSYEFRMKLLRFYPFRLFDALLPIAAAVVLVNLLLKNLEPRQDAVQKNNVGWFLWGVPTCCLIFSLLNVPVDRDSSRMAVAQKADWISACSWIDENLPADSLLLTPKSSWAFHWYAQRAEYVSFKNCPQDVRGIVEWNRRLRFLKSWGQQNFLNGYSNSVVNELVQETKVTHILAQRLGPFDMEPVYQNATYKLYQLPDLE